MNIQCDGGSRSLAKKNKKQKKKSSKGDESHEDEERSGQTSEADNDQLRAIIEADSLTTTREVAEELSVNSTII